MDSPSVIKLGAGATIHQNKAYPKTDFLKIVGQAARKRLSATATLGRAKAASASSL
jgi:hypothetical protein